MSLAVAFVVACGGTEKTGAVPAEPGLATADGLHLHWNERAARLGSLSIPGRAGAAAEGPGVWVYDHRGDLLVDGSAAPVSAPDSDSQWRDRTLRLVRQSPGHGLRVTESWSAHEHHIELQATITDTRQAAARSAEQAAEQQAGQAEGRPIEACLVLPMDLIGATWHHHVHQSEVIEPGEVYRTLLTDALDIGHWAPPGQSTHLKSDLPFNLHGLNLVSDERFGLALAMHPDAPAAYYAEYDASARRLSACFHLGIYPGHRTRPHSTGFRLVLFRPDQPAWGLRAALDEYARIFPSAFRGRLPRQTRMTAGGAYAFHHYPDPSAFHIGAMWNAFYPQNRDAGIHNLLYAWPTGFIDRGMRLSAQHLSTPCATCDPSANAHIAACLAIYEDYEDGRLRFPQTCADTWSQTQCVKSPVQPAAPTLYGPVHLKGGYYHLRPVQVGAPSNLALRLFGKFAMHEPMTRSILRDASGGHADALSSGRAIIKVDDERNAYTCFINGINPDPGVEVMGAERAGEAGEAPIDTANFGHLNLEIAKRATGVYGSEYVHTDARRGPMIYDGVAVDTVGAYLRADFNPAMLEVATPPLSYDRATGRVVALEQVTFTAFLRALRDVLPEDAALAINGYPISGTLGQGVDHFVRELGRRWRKEPADDKPRFYHELYDEDLATRLRRIYRLRMVAYQRPITFWARFVHTRRRAEEQDKPPERVFLEDIRRFLPLYTAQGIYIYIQRTGIGDRDLFFTQPQSEAVLAEYKRHLDTVHELTRAGWEPVTYAVVSDAAVLAERFGTSHISLYNAAAETKRVTVTIDRARLGHDEAVSVRDLHSGEVIASEDAGGATVVHVPMAPGSVRVLVLGS